MKTKTTETTKTSQMVTINTVVKDDGGMDIAKMSATINSSTPFGNTNLVILNKNLFDEYEDSMRKLYLTFQEEISNIDLQDEDSTIEKEGEVTLSPNPVVSEDKKEENANEN